MERAPFIDQAIGGSIKILAVEVLAVERGRKPVATLRELSIDQGGIVGAAELGCRYDIKHIGGEDDIRVRGKDTLGIESCAKILNVLVEQELVARINLRNHITTQVGHFQADSHLGMILTFGISTSGEEIGSQQHSLFQRFEEQATLPPTAGVGLEGVLCGHRQVLKTNS